MLEKDIEKYLVKRVKEVGGTAYKFVSPGNAGVPDRLVCLSGGAVFFVELKALGLKPTPLQVKKQRELAKLGQRVFVADSKEGIDEILGVKYGICAT